MIKLVYDIEAIQQAVMSGKYDQKGLVYDETGQNKYKFPSKLMFIKFLEPLFKEDLKDIDGTCSVTSDTDREHGVRTITVVLKYGAK